MGLTSLNSKENDRPLRPVVVSSSDYFKAPRRQFARVGQIEDFILAVGFCLTYLTSLVIMYAEQSCQIAVVLVTNMMLSGNNFRAAPA